MIERTEKRTVEDLHRIVSHLESTYSDFHSKATSVLQSLKSTSKSLGVPSSSSHKYDSDILMWCVELYQQVWLCSTSKILKLQEDQYFFETLKDRIRQFSDHYRETKNDIQQTEKDIALMKQMHGSLERLFNEYQQPTIFYNTVERVNSRKLLEDKLNEYLSKKGSFLSDYASKKKVISYIHHMTDYFTKQVDEGLLKGTFVISKIQESLLSGIRQFIFYILNTCAKELARMERFETCSQWALPAEEFKREHLSILSKLQRHQLLPKLDTHYSKYFKFCKEMIERLENEAKSAEGELSKMRFMGEILAAVKVNIDRELREAEIFKEKLHKICPDPNLFQSYKMTLVGIMKIIDITVISISQSIEVSKSIERTSREKRSIATKIKTEVDRNLERNPQNLIRFCQSRSEELKHIERIEIEGRKSLKQAVIRNIKAYEEEIKGVEAILLSGHKQLHKYKRENYLVKTRLVREILTVDLLNDDSLEKVVAASLTELMPYVSNGKETPVNVYNCALGGKLILMGKMKLFQEVLIFESLFNKKNLFFGTTNLVIPLTDISQIKKESVMLVSNAIVVETKKGPITFTSLYNRDLVFNEITDLLETEEEANKNNSVCESVVSELTVAQIFNEEEVASIETRKNNLGKQFFENLKVVIPTKTFPGLTLRKFWRLIYSDNNEIVKRKKSYSCFKEYVLSHTNNIEVKPSPIQPPPPSCFEKGSPIKLLQAQKSNRTIVYKHQLGSIPIPFMPKYGNVTEKEVFNWVSDKMLVLETETLTTGAPYSDSFVLKLKAIVEETETGVNVSMSGEVVFVKSASFQGIIRSTAEKEILQNTLAVLKFTSEYLTENKNKKKKAKAGEVVQDAKEQEEETATDAPSNSQQIDRLQMQNKKNLLLASAVFVIILLVTHVWF